MRIGYYRVLKWTLSAGAFVTIVASVTGCSRIMSALHLKFDDEPKASRNVVATVQRTPTGNDDDRDTAPSAPSRKEMMTTPAGGDAVTFAPKVDVFGEFDGAERGVTGDSAEAGFQQHTFTTEGNDADVTASADGKWIAFASTRHFDRSKIYLQRVGGTSVTQLTSDAAEDAYPSFSPDGHQIAFSSTRSGNWDVYVMDIDGKNLVQVTSAPSQELHPSFSPDGTRLVYCSVGGKNSQWELWTVNLTTNEKKMIGFGLFPSWSPRKDADRIAFQRARQRGSRWFSLWTLDLVDGEARRVTELALSSNAAIVSPSWSPDGERLAFATIVEPANAGGTKSHAQQDIWTIDADGANRHRLTDGIGTNLSPFWSVDNRIFFVSDRGGTECVWSAKSEAGRIAEAKKPETKKSDAVGSADMKEVGN